MKNTIVPALILSLLSLNCASSAVPPAATATCAPSPELLGRWKSYRTSSLGPAWMSLTLDCDCTARVVSQLLFFRYSEVVPYRIEDDELVFTREHSETRWPFSFNAKTLIVQEAPSESHRYRRIEERSCGAVP